MKVHFCFVFIFITIINSYAYTYTSKLSLRSLATKKKCILRSAPVIIIDQSQQPPVSYKETKASFTASTINLMKNTAGAGVFSLSGKLLSVTGSTDVLIPQATILIFVLAAWAVYNFYIITETCRMTNAATYDDCWGKSISVNTKWIIQGVVSFAPLIGITANVIILTDILGSVLQAFGGAIATLALNRNIVAGLLCTCIIYPLCSLKDLNSMKSTSLFGLLGNLISLIAIGIRSMDKSYLKTGIFASKLLIPTATSTSVSLLSQSKSPVLFQWAVFASLLSYCYVTHYNAPKYYNELEDPSPKNIISMTSLAYLGGALIYIGSMSLGISAFGNNVKSYLLNNFASNDPLGLIARLSLGASILTSTPLMFIAVRNRLVDTAKTKLPILADIKKMAGLLILIIGLITTKITDISVLASIAGGLLGVNMMFTIPSIMYLSTLHKNAKINNTEVSMFTDLIHIMMILMGLTISAIGTGYSILKIFQ